jgi:O-antigen/teichoic acid export membrane protein
MSKLTKNVIYNLTGQVLLLVLGFVAARFVFKQLGEDALGVIYFALALNILLTNALAMGICETTVREVSSHVRSEPGYIADLLRSASLFYWGIYVVLSLVIYAGAPVLVHRWIHLSSIDATTAIRVLRILGIASFVVLPRTFYASILRGLERMEFPNLIDVTFSGLQQFGIIGILAFGGGFLDVVYWMAACFLLSVAAYLIVCARFVSWSSLMPGFSSAVVSRNFSFTSHVALISVMAMIQTQADKAIVSKLLPIGVFGLYSLAYSAVSRSTLLTGSVAQAGLPHLSSLFQQGDHAKLLTQFNKLQDLICFGTVPFFAAVPFVARPLFTGMFDAHSAQILLLPVTFLAIGFYMNGSLTALYIFSIAAGRPDIAARLNVYALVLVLPATAALIYYFGLSGAGFSWVFFHLFAYSYQVPRTCSECLKIPSRMWFAKIFKIAGIIAMTYGSAWVLLMLTGLEHGLFWPLAGYVMATLGFAGIAYRMVGHELRGSFRGQLFVLAQRAKGAQVV